MNSLIRFKPKDRNTGREENPQQMALFLLAIREEKNTHIQVLFVQNLAQ
jgi:hypothetical protein